MEKDNELKPANQENNRNLDGTFKKGMSGNLNGRPKGQSLKEYWRQRFQNMTDEEKIAFTDKVGADTVWKMAEGNPDSKSEVKTDLTLNMAPEDKEKIKNVIRDQSTNN